MCSMNQHLKVDQKHLYWDVMQQARTLVISDNKPKGDQQKPFTILNTNDVVGQTLLICKYSLFNLQIDVLLQFLLM